MNLGDFFFTYYIQPINQHAGYNPVNTITYAVLALISLFFVYKWFEKEGWKFDKGFAKALIPWLLFGSTKRVITDAVYGEALKGGLYNLYQWNWFNVSPAIYVFVAVLFFLTYWAEKKYEKEDLTYKIGIGLFALHILLLFPAIRFWSRLVLPAILVGLVYALTYKFFGEDKLALWAVLAQALDGAATFTATTFYGYGEQHVVSSFIGEAFGYHIFFLLKVVLAFLVAYLVRKEAKEDEGNLILLAVLTIGLAPGFRDILRMMAGV